MFHNAVTVASMPLIAEIHDRSDAKRLGAFFRTTTQWTTTFNLPFLLILLLFPHQLLSIFGKGFESGATALGILAWANLAVFATGPVGVIIDMTGNTWVKFANSILLVGLAIVLNLVLIPPYGLVGAAVADLAANVLINVVRLGEVWLLLGLHPYGRPFLKPILAAVVAAGAGVATGRLLPAQHGPILEAVLGSVALSVVYVAMIVALGISAEDRALLGRVRTALVSRGARASRRRARAERGREDAP